MSFEVDTGAAKDGHLSDSDSTNDTGDSNHSNEKENEEPRHLPAVLKVTKTVAEIGAEIGVLKGLHDEGLINAAEFASGKKDLLEQLKS
jgi:hypothetical protein